MFCLIVEHGSNEDVKPSEMKTPGKSQNNQNDQEKFNKLVMEAKQLIGDGKVKAALDLNRQALTICHSEKLAKKVAKMEVRSHFKSFHCGYYWII